MNYTLSEFLKPMCQTHGNPGCNALGHTMLFSFGPSKCAQGVEAIPGDSSQVGDLAREPNGAAVPGTIWEHPDNAQGLQGHLK